MHTVQGSASTHHLPEGNCPLQLHTLSRLSSTITRLSVRHADYKRKEDNGVSLERVFGFITPDRAPVSLAASRCEREGAQLPFINSPIACRPSVRS